MSGKLIMCIVSFGGALLFYGLGIHAQKLSRPMGFWSGAEMDASRITDVRGYNRENGIMWKRYSLWYVVAGVVAVWSVIASAILLVTGCTVGLALLIAAYRKICRKYQVR